MSLFETIKSVEMLNFVSTLRKKSRRISRQFAEAINVHWQWSVTRCGYIYIATRDDDVCRSALTMSWSVLTVDLDPVQLLSCPAKAWMIPVSVNLTPLWTLTCWLQFCPSQQLHPTYFGDGAILSKGMTHSVEGNLSMSMNYSAINYLFNTPLPH